MPAPRKAGEARTARQDLRIEPSRKTRWEAAAQAEGLSVCDWLIVAAEDRISSRASGGSPLQTPSDEPP